DAGGLGPSELFLCAIHTHSAPTLMLSAENGHVNNVEYTKSLQQKLVDVVKTALDRLTVVKVGVGIGSSRVGANRREAVQGDDGKTKITLGRNPSVLTDREVQVLS